jgi:hypothetical protein
MSEDGIHECFIVEDEKRSIKVRGETRIPAGRYRIKYREVLSEKTIKYRAKYPWFKWHIELQSVPGFQFVYIHIGNTEKDSDGCLLANTSVNMDTGVGSGSTAAFQKLYKKICPLLDADKEVWITINDEQ